jgi:hypothetical protein
VLPAQHTSVSPAPVVVKPELHKQVVGVLAEEPAEEAELPGHGAQRASEAL